MINFKKLLIIICEADAKKIDKELEEFINKCGQKENGFITVGNHFNDYYSKKITEKEKKSLRQWEDYIFFTIVEREIKKKKSYYESINIVKRYDWFDADKFFKSR